VNLADYLDAAIYAGSTPQTFAPLAPQRVVYAGRTPTTAAPMTTRTATVFYAGQPTTTATAPIPTPPNTLIRTSTPLLPGMTPLIPGASTSTATAPAPSDAAPTPPPDASAPSSDATISQEPVYAKSAVPTPPPEETAPPADSSEASGDSGSSSAGFGWLLIVVGGYFLYKGLK